MGQKGKREEEKTNPDRKYVYNIKQLKYFCTIKINNG